MRNIPGSVARVDPIMKNRRPDQLAWIGERFEGEPVGGNYRPMPVDQGIGPLRPPPISGHD
jgi:hypothetical protein